jgi:hypothetical protein
MFRISGFSNVHVRLQFFRGNRRAGLRDFEAEIRKNLIGLITKIIYQLCGHGPSMRGKIYANIHD